MLGGGIDVVYPRENAALYDDIAASGVLISEYPPGTEPKGHHFLERNRIISGLSAAVVVVEAALRSGTLNTVHHALEQSRDVYAVPGPVDAPCSQGCNRLIQEGAGLVSDGWDILRDLQPRFPQRIERYLFDLPPSIGRGAAEKGTAAQQEAPAEDAVPAENEIDKTEEKAYIEIENSRDRFTDDQIQLLLTLSEHPMTVDDLAETAQIPVRRVLSALTDLEIDALVRQVSGNRYILNALIKE